MVWDTGEQKVLYHSNIFDIEVKKIAVRRSTRLKSSIDQYRLALRMNEGSAGDLLAVNYNINVLRPVLHRLYKEVLDSYPNRNGLIMQINLGLAQLRKQWLKSGPFDPTKIANESFCDWMVNMLETCAFSDDQLSLQGLHIDIIITREEHTVEGPSNEQEIYFNYMPFQCRRISNSIANYDLYKNKKFLKKIKFGILDMAELGQSYVNQNCLKLTLAIALLSEKKRHNIIEVLKSVVVIYQGRPDLMVSDSKIAEFDSNTNNFFKQIDNYSMFLKRNIYIMCVGSTGAMKIFYKSDCQKSNKLPIYILHTNPNDSDDSNAHCAYVYKVNLNQRGKHFCKICQKTFTSTFKSHICRLPRCKSCLLYFSHKRKLYSIDGQPACLSKFVFNYFKKCLKCGRVFTNKACLEKHESEKVMACNKFRHCNKCRKMFSNQSGHTHRCLEFWCGQCLAYHIKDQTECYVKQLDKFKSRDVAKTNPCYFNLLLNWSHDMKPIICLCSPINETRIVYAKSAFTETMCVIDNIDNFDFSIINNGNQGNYTMENVFYPLLQYIEKLYAPKCVTFITSNSSFDYIIRNISSVPIKVNYCGESPSTIKIFTTVIKKLSNFFDNSVNNLALECLTVNSASTLMPHRLQHCHTLDINHSNPLDANEFPVQDVIGTAFADYQRLLKDQMCIGSIYEQMNTDRILYFKIVTNQLSVLETVTFKLQSVFALLLKDTLAIVGEEFPNQTQFSDILPHLFSYNTSTTAVFNLHLMCTPKNALPILSSNIPSEKMLVGVSRAEILVSKFFYNIHKKVCKTDNILSYISGNRKQFTTESNLSCDFYCKSCKVAIFVQGMYKSHCLYHKTNENISFFGSTSKHMKYISDVKLGKFKKLAGNSVSRIVEIFECCVNSKEYWVECKNTVADELIKFLKCNAIDMQGYQEIFIKLKHDFTIEDNIALNYQTSVQSQIIESLQLYNSESLGSKALPKSKVLRYDLNSAYVRSLQNPNLKLPQSSNLIILHDEEAQSFFEKNVLHSAHVNDLPYCIIKARVYLDRVFESAHCLPYFTYINSKNKSSLSLCCQCSEAMTSEPCMHTPTERSFLVTCLTEDFYYAHKLGYYFSIKELHFWPIKSHYTGLAKLASLFLKHKENGDKFTSKIVKKWALSSIGRWAMNYENFGTWEKIENFVHLMYLKNKKNLKCYDIFNEADCYALIKTRKYNVEKIKCRSNVSCLIFASICSDVKRRIHQDSLMVHLSNNLSLIRIDADCLTIECLLTEAAQSDCKKIFERKDLHLIYKCEKDCIDCIMCYKKRSYSIQYKKYILLKTCGFSASLCKRYSILDFKNIYADLIHRITHDKKLLVSHHMRIPAIGVSRMTGNSVCYTHPFGMIRQV